MFVNCVCQFIYYSGSIGPFNLGNIGIVGNGIIKGTRSLPFPAITDGVVGGRVVVWVLDLSKSVDTAIIDELTNTIYKHFKMGVLTWKTNIFSERLVNVVDRLDHQRLCTIDFYNSSEKYI
jgi:hypothetical protein